MDHGPKHGQLVLLDTTVPITAVMVLLDMMVPEHGHGAAGHHHPNHGDGPAGHDVPNVGILLDITVYNYGPGHEHGHHNG